MPDVAFHRPDREYPLRVPKTTVTLLVPPPVEGPLPMLASVTQFCLVVAALLAVGSTAFVHARDNRVLEGTLIGAVAAVVIALGMRSIGTGKRKRLREDRLRYYHYLRQQETKLRKAADAQRHVDERLYPTTDSIAALAADRRFLWERRMHDADFMSVCAGRGRLPLDCPATLDVDDSTSHVFEPLLLQGARTLVEHFTTLSDGAVTMPMREAATLAIVGDADRVRPIARSIVAQAAVFHAPLDLHMMGFLTADGQGEWEWLKWLPHVRPREDRGRLCTLTDDVGEFVSMLAAEIAPRHEALRKASAARAVGIPAPRQPSELPHLLILIDGFDPRSPLASAAPVAEAIKHGAMLGVTVLMVVPPHHQPPPDLDIVVAAGRQMATVQYRGPGSAVDVRPETISVERAETMARAMAPLRLDEENPREELAGSARLVGLLGLSDAAALDPATAWRPRPRATMLRAPIGVGAAETTIVLDLKEAASGGMGPHGLIAGSAGSGKSELLRDIITGLAAANSPESLSIACIDVEGAGSFEEFHTLPHLAGIIGGPLTDDDAVELMRTSLLEEQERRRRLLAGAGSPGNVRAYQKQREQNPAMEPMPWLLVVVDDAGRLLSARHDLLSLFTALAPGDHNLGIHLLLSGRAFDSWTLRAFEGLLRYRICLHMDSAQESSAVLGTTDAYHLPDIPGAAYLKVDAAHPERFRVARVSAPYDEHAEGDSAAGTIRLFTAIHHRATNHQGNGTATLEPTYTEMDVIVERLAHAQATPSAVRLFVPPKAPEVTLETVLEVAANREHAALGQAEPFGHLRVPVGLAVGGDDDAGRSPVFIDLSEGANLGLVAAAGMGRSTFLQTVLGALILTHRPDDLRIACLDLGGGGLGAFAGAPHLIGGGQEDPSAVVAAIRRIIGEREAAMVEHGVATTRDLPADGLVAATDVVLAIDNLPAMGADLLDGLADILRRGKATGVTVVATAGSWLEIPSEIRTALDTRMELRLKVPRHSVIDPALAEMVPKLPGQGLAPDRSRVHIALPRLDHGGGVRDLDAGVRDLVNRAAAAWAGPNPPAAHEPRAEAHGGADAEPAVPGAR